MPNMRVMPVKELHEELEQLKKMRESLTEDICPKYKRSVEEAIRALGEEIAITFNTIMGIRKTSVRRAMILRYIEGMKLEEVAEELHYSRRQVARLIKEGVNEITPK